MNTVAVIGLGYVVLPLAMHFGKSGLTAVGNDIDPAKITFLSRGESYIAHLAAADIRNAMAAVTPAPRAKIWKA